MANMEKYSSMQDIGHLCAHYARGVKPGHYSNLEIDESRTYQNYNLAPFREKPTKYIKDVIRSIAGEKRIRKDAVRMVSWVINAPQNLPSAYHTVFFQETYNFLVDRYGCKSGMGEEIVISSHIHADENTKHMHFAFIPIVEINGVKKLCAKEVVGRSDLKTFHEDLQKYLHSKGIRCDILNGATQRDSTGRAYSVRELKRIKYLRERERSRERGRW